MKIKSMVDDASAVSYQAEHGIPPWNGQVTISEVWASIILYYTLTTSDSLLNTRSTVDDLEKMKLN